MIPITRIEDYPIVNRGSVKNVREITAPTPTQMGDYIFEFTNDTSVKDRGKLGFETPSKGASLCALAVYNFQELEKLGIPTIFSEQISETAIRVAGVRVLNPDEMDLHGVHNRIFPLEIISRDVLTGTSSAAKHLKSGKAHPHKFGLSAVPTEYPVFLPMTVVDGSTKLRATDEYHPWDVLKDLSHATTADMNTVRAYILQTTLFAQQHGASVGFMVFDHKDEYVYDPSGRIILGDVPLGLDELTGAQVGRFTDYDQFRGKSFVVFQAGVDHDTKAFINASKQLYRDHYDADHPEWVAAVKDGLAKGVPKRDLPAVPQPPRELVEIVSTIYQAFANEWVGQRLFNVGSLHDATENYRRWATDHYQLKEK